MNFYKFIMAERKSGPPKPWQKNSSRSQARRALNCLPKADELFIANQTGVRVYNNNYHKHQNRAVLRCDSVPRSSQTILNKYVSVRDCRVVV